MPSRTSGTARQASQQPPFGCQHYYDLSRVPWDVQKYYHQRYNIFSKYDAGVRMTEDAWFEVTPEPVADKIAQHVASVAPAVIDIIIDCFAGVGGNTIAFAKTVRWAKVYAVEKDPASLKCAKHNAEVYGVADKISWYEGNCFEVLRNDLRQIGQRSIIFGSPPWGGPGYRLDSVFNLVTMQPYDLDFLVSEFRQTSDNLVLYLPRTSDVRQLAAYATTPTKMTVVHYCMEGASKVNPDIHTMVKDSPSVGNLRFLRVFGCA